MKIEHKMKVRLLKPHGFSQVGEILDVRRVIALLLIQSGKAEAVAVERDNQQQQIGKKRR